MRFSIAHAAGIINFAGLGYFTTPTSWFLRFDAPLHEGAASFRPRSWSHGVHFRHSHLRQVVARGDRPNAFSFSKFGLHCGETLVPIWVALIWVSANS